MKVLSEAWLGLLISAYFMMLLIAFFRSPSLLAEELKLFGWYFVVGLLAAVWAHDLFVVKGPIADGVEINLFGLFRNYWHDVVLPFSLAFVCLSLPRHLILALQYWRKRKQSDQITAE